MDYSLEKCWIWVKTICVNLFILFIAKFEGLFQYSKLLCVDTIAWTPIVIVVSGNHLTDESEGRRFLLKLPGA